MSPVRAGNVQADALLTVDEVAGLFRVDAKTVRRWVAEEKLRAIRTPTGRIRFRWADVKDHLMDGGDAA